MATASSIRFTYGDLPSDHTSGYAYLGINASQALTTIDDSGNVTVYSSTSHNHDTDYSPLSHNHDLLYSSISHNHDTDYSPLSHNHDTIYVGLTGDQNINGNKTFYGNITINVLSAGIVKSNINGLLSTESENTAFNKNFGTQSGEVAEGNHTHPEQQDNSVIMAIVFGC